MTRMIATALTLALLAAPALAGDTALVLPPKPLQARQLAPRQCWTWNHLANGRVQCLSLPTPGHTRTAIGLQVVAAVVHVASTVAVVTAVGKVERRYSVGLVDSREVTLATAGTSLLGVLQNLATAGRAPKVTTATAVASAGVSIFGTVRNMQSLRVLRPYVK